MALLSRTVFGSPPTSAHEAQELLDSLVMTWANDIETGLPVYVMELDSSRNGGKCGCECASCGHPLKAANAGKAEGTYFQKPHFKHQAGVAKDSCLVLAARAAALRLLVEDGMIDLPSRSRTSSWVGLSGAEYPGAAGVLPQRRSVTHAQFCDRTSAILTLDDGRQLLVRLTGTNTAHGPTSEGASDARATVYIDIGDPRLAALSPDELRARLKLLPDKLCWHGHWDDAALDAQASMAARAHAQEMLDWPDGASEVALETVPPEYRRETVLHLAVKQILAAAGRFRVPALEIQEVAGSEANKCTAGAVLVKSQFIGLSNARLEHRLGRIIPDVCADATDVDGTSMGLLCIEVTVTHGFDAERLERVRRANLLTLEIDLSEAFGRISRSDLAKLVIDGVDGKRWVHHPDFARRQEELRTSAQLASRAKAQEIEEAVRAERARAAAKSTAEPLKTRSNALVPRPELPSPAADVDRCRQLVRARGKSEWVPDEALLHGLLSLRHGTGIGCHRGLTAMQVAHKLRCSIDTHLHSLVLIALSAFGASNGQPDQTVLDEWAAATREKVRKRDSMWIPPAGALDLLKELMPELSDAADKMVDYLRRPAPTLTWTTSEPSHSQLQSALAMRRELYHNGA